MKKTLLSLMGLLSLGLHAQWQSTSNNTGGDVIAAFSGVYSSDVGGNGLHVSNDNGASWSNSNTGVPSAGLNFGLFYSNNLYAFRNNTVYTTSTGNNWTAMSGAFTSTDVIRSIAANGGTLFAGSSPFSGNGYKIFRYTGSTWTQVSSVSGAGSPILTHVRDGGTSGTLFAGTTNSTVLKSTNAGVTFTPSSTGIPNTTMDRFVSALATNGNTLFAGTSSGKIFRSTNGGSSWSQVYNIGDGISTFYINDIYIMSGNNILVASDSGFVYSSNGGTSWQKSNAGLNPSNYELIMRKITVSPTHIIAAVATMVGTKIVRRPLGEVFTGASLLEHEINVSSIVYPNPASEKIEIKSDALMFEENCKVSIYDIFGRMIHEYDLNNGHVEINTSLFANGLYSYLLSSNGLVVGQGKFLKN